MFNLIRKDIVFNKKHILIVLFGCLAASIGLAFEEGNLGIFSFFMSFSVLFTYMVSVACQNDDKGSTTGFLRALPIRPAAIVSAKYVLAILTLLLAFGLSSGVNLFLPLFNLEPMILNSSTLLFLAGFALVYMGVFLFIFFRYGFSATRYTVIVLLAGILGTKRLVGQDIPLPPTLNQKFLSFWVMAISLTLFSLFWFLAGRKVHNDYTK